MVTVREEQDVALTYFCFVSLLFFISGLLLNMPSAQLELLKLWGKNKISLLKHKDIHLNEETSHMKIKYH